MEITTHSSQIVVSENGGSGGANVSSCVSGYIADLHFWGDAAYLARRPGESGLHIMIAPSAKWTDEIRAAGFEIIGKLSNLANTEITSREATPPKP